MPLPRRAILLGAFVVTLATADRASADASAASVRPPPPTVLEAFHVSPFYAKYTDVGGVPIVASAAVDDRALREAAYVIEHMIGHRPEVLAALAKARVRVAVMGVREVTTDIPEHSDLTPKAYWNRRARGLGATTARPAVSCAEENMLEFPGDPYSQENILVHEFAHAIHQMALSSLDPTFDRRLDAAYQNARATGLWRGTYAMENKEEYWAEASQSWFDTNRANDREHGAIDTRAKLVPYDPAIAALLRDAYGDRPWRYLRPSLRPASERAHLAGLDPAKSPRFAWPASAPPLENAAVSPPADPTPLVPPSPSLTWFPPEALPARSSVATKLTFVNKRSRPVDVVWIAFDGKRTKYSTIAPGLRMEQPTYAGHAWVLVEDGKDLGGVVAMPGPSVVEIR